MSKLYDVISRLEEVASQGENGEESPQSELTELRREKKPAWVRMVLLGTLFVALGLATIGGTTWLQKRFVDKQSPQLTTTSNKPAIAPQQPATKPGVVSAPPSLPLPEDKSSISASRERANSTTARHIDTIKERQMPTITGKFRGAMSVDVAAEDITVENIDQFLAAGLFDFQELLEEATSTKTRITIHNLDIAEAIPETPAQPQEPLYTYAKTNFQDDQKAKASRWLHQAELYRHQGEWEGAIVLYQRVWNISQDPAVANNLAAALIEVNRPKKAYTILKETISSAPEDPDIRQNLQLVEQILNQ